MSSKLTRRRFTQTTLAAGLAAVASPMLVPARAFGANDRVVLGAIGMGNRGPQVASGMKKYADYAAVADIYLPRAQKAAEKFGAQNAYQDYRKLLEQKDIDAVVIATPHRWHAIHSIHAAQAGKDIYCEKPQTYTIREGRAIVEAVKKYKRVFQTGSQQRSGTNEYKGCMHVRNGSLGKITKVIAPNLHSPMEPNWPQEDVPEGLDWDRWCGPAVPPPFNFVIWDNRSNPSWVSIRTFSGGEMTDWGAHGYDMAQWGLGMDESGPEEIWTEGEPFKKMISTPEAPGGRHRGPSGPKVVMKYPGGIIMEMAGGVSNSGVRFIGEKGVIEVTRGRCKPSSPELLEKPLEDMEVQLYRSKSHDGDWIECIKERRDPAAHAEVGHRSVTIAHLANIARWMSEITGETGQKLKWDAKAERFTNSDEANKFLDAAYRKGYELPTV